MHSKTIMSLGSDSGSVLTLNILFSLHYEYEIQCHFSWFKKCYLSDIMWGFNFFSSVQRSWVLIRTALVKYLQRVHKTILNKIMKMIATCQPILLSHKRVIYSRSVQLVVLLSSCYQCLAPELIRYSAASRDCEEKKWKVDSRCSALAI